MSGFRPFTRQLGAQPGVQLNPLADTTDGTALGNSDQYVAAVVRMTRGRIDRPFRVDRSNFQAKTGAAEAVRVNALNEGRLQVYEALESGAAGAVLQRLAPAGAVKRYAVANFSGSPAQTAATVAYSVATTPPSAAYSMYLIDHECLNSGIKWSLHADATPTGGPFVDATEVTMRVFDAQNVLRYEVSGSLDPAAKDDFNQSRYLPDLVASQTDSNLELVVAANAKVPTTSDAYGRGTDGRPKWATSDVLLCFDEGGTTYTAQDYDRCVAALRDTQLPYGYLISGGTQVLSLLGKLGALAADTNIPFKFDISGNLTVEAAIAMRASLGFDSHLVHAYWAPLEADDPMSGGRVVFGAAGVNAGYSCARNARINAAGFAPKNQPVAGRAYPLRRTGIRQLRQLTEQEESDLAQAQINPVTYQTFNGGGSYVFGDVLTTSKSQVSYKKLIPAAEMSATLDNWVATQAKELLLLPMSMFIKRMDAFMEALLSQAQASEWLVPSRTLRGGAAYEYTVKQSLVKPADTVHIDYWTSFDGVARQVHIQQTLVK